MAFAIGSVVSLLAGVKIEIAVLRGGIAFLIFLIFGWLMAYLVYEDESAIQAEKHVEEEGPEEAPPEETENEAGKEAEMVEDAEIQGLKPPDDSDF